MATQEIRRSIHRNLSTGRLVHVRQGELPDGPWHAEPDHVEFEHDGMPCILHRNAAWCGYVAVPPGHPWHGKSYDQVDVDVHGGPTYAEKCSGKICHVAKPGEPDDVWWIGFDCNHHGDLSLHDVNDYGSYRDDGHLVSLYRTVDYVKAETIKLAEQAKAAAVTP